MKWNRFTIKTKTDAEDMIICTLAEIGVEGAEIQDHQPLTEEDKAQMFVDIMPEGPEDDGVDYTVDEPEDEVEKAERLLLNEYKHEEIIKAESSDMSIEEAESILFS